MNINILLIKKIESILEKSGKFDKICSVILSGDVELNEISIKNIKELTTLYIKIRSEHGNIILLNDKLKKDINIKESSIEEETTNKLYDLSTFTSITDNINNLVSNIDFEFKKIALMYPKMINRENTHLLLFIKNDDKTNKYVKIIEDVKKIKPENEYHIIECDQTDKKIDCGKILEMKLSLEIKKLPCLFLINGKNIAEISIDKIINSNDLIKMLD